MNHIFDLNEIVFVPKHDLIGKIIDVAVFENNTAYLIVFDDGTFDSFLGKDLAKLQGVM